MLFFSDAVFAIAITLLVIEIRLPHLGSESEAGLRAALLGLAPHYIGFLVSFFVIGRFWMGHHRLFGYLERSDGVVVWRNMLFLAAIAFLPFPTAVIGEHGGLATAVVAYAAWLFVAGLLNPMLVRHIAGHSDLMAQPIKPAQRRSLRSAWQPIIIAVAAGATALAQPAAAVGVLLPLPFVRVGIARLSR